MPIHEAAMWSAFQQTAYVAWLEDGEVEVRIGHPTPALDRLLDRLGACSWCFITAWNPGAVRLEAAENDRRNRALEAELRRPGWHVHPGEGRGDDGRWPAEPSFLVVGPSAEEAVRLGARYGQVAVVVGSRGEPAALADCRIERGAHG